MNPTSSPSEDYNKLMSSILPRPLKSEAQIVSSLAGHADLHEIVEYKQLIEELFFRYSMSQTESGHFTDTRANLVINCKLFVEEVIDAAMSAVILKQKEK
jgi:hypothetical protein